jgi:hypothetical protein
MENREPAPPFFLLILNLYGEQPEFQTGWFCDRWRKMTTDDRNRWITFNLEELRTMWRELGITGFGKFGDSLPACLELVDEQMPTNY